jgi:hypothetical protein
VFRGLVALYKIEIDIYTILNQFQHKKFQFFDPSQKNISHHMSKKEKDFFSTLQRFKDSIMD